MSLQLRQKPGPGSLRGLRGAGAPGEAEELHAPAAQLDGGAQGTDEFHGRVVGVDRGGLGGSGGGEGVDGWTRGSESLGKVFWG